MKPKFELCQKCLCGSEMISYEYDPKLNLVYCMLYTVTPNNFRLLDKLKAAYNCLFGGSISYGDLVLNHEHIQELTTYFNQLNLKINENKNSTDQT